MNKIKISFAQIKKYLGSSVEEFPKYSTQILNLANQDSQATRPKIVGQLSQLIQEFSEILKNQGRVLVRYSGTELIARILVEGKNKMQIQGFANQIAKTLDLEIKEVKP